jgi:hypothetical protein
MKRLLAITCVALAGPVLAAQSLHVSVEALSRESDLVVRGRVASVVSRFSDDGLRIFTYAEVDVASTWRGESASRVTVLVPGGVVGDLGQRVDGAPTLSDGEEVVLFLHRAEAGLFRVSGLAQGKLSVRGGVARPELSHLGFLGTRVREGERAVEAMPLADLERRVRAAR